MASLQLPADVETWLAQRVVEYVLDEFPGRVALACSFQKEESVLLDMVFELEPKARVFAIDTHHLFPETYELWRAVERRYGTTIHTFAGAAVEDGLWAVAVHRFGKAWADLVVASLGGHGELVERPEEVGPALERAFRSGLPACVNVVCDPKAEYPRSSVLM